MVDDLLGKVFRSEQVDFSDLESGYTMPEGYILASLAHYEGGKSPLGDVDLGYEYSVQLLNQATGRMPRGTGNTVDAAILDAIGKV